MALIKCEECGKEISDKAKACVYCGCPILKNDCNESKEFAIKQSTNEIFDKNSRKLSVEFNAVVSNKSKESTLNNIYIKELDRSVEILVPNNIKENEKIWKKLDNDSKCDFIVFTVKNVSIDSSIKSIATEKKSKKKANENKTIYDVIENYTPNCFVRFFDGPGVTSVIGLFITFAIIQEMWYIEVLIAFFIITFPLLLGKMFIPFLNARKYIKKNHIDEAIKNNPDYLNIATLTYELMPCRKMLWYIKKINIDAGLEIERKVRKKIL